MSVSNHTINFNANLGPLQGALQGFGATAEGLLTRLRAVAAAPISIPVGTQISGSAAAGLSRPFASAANLPVSSFGASGRVAADARANLEAQVRRQISLLGKKDILGPQGGETRGRALLAERRQVLEKAALQKLTELIAVREADIANQLKLGALRVQEEQLILVSKNEEFLAQEAVVDSLAGEAALRRANTRRQGALSSVEQQARRIVVETEATTAKNDVRTAALSAEENKIAVIRLNLAKGRLAGEASVAKDQGLADALSTEEALTQKTRAVVSKARLKSESILAGAADEQVVLAEIETIVVKSRTKKAGARAAAADLALREDAIQLKIEKSITTDLGREAVAVRRHAALAASSSRLDRAQARGGVTGGLAKSVNAAGGVGGFFGSGLATTLRFAIPSILLFGAITGVAKLIKEAEELEQVFIRLDSQFESLGRRGVFGGDSPTEQIESAKEALGGYRKELFSIAAATGLANDTTAELGQQFIGLFSSIDSGGKAKELAEEATRITAEFTVITGLEPAETFNDLVGSVRSFGDTGTEVIVLIDRLTDAVVNVSDATGVSAGEITDFVGRIGPAAAQAGLDLNEVIALGATALQGSGVGGSALAEQFGRVLTGLSGELGIELSKLAQDLESAFSNVDLGDGLDASQLFNIDTISKGEVDKVLIGLINGFDALTEAQQRQIVASIGSRREGAALAAVLQNASTFNNALDSAADAAGQRQERFTDIIARLTGQLNRLKVAFAQTGQDLFDSGLGDVLEGILAGVGNLAQAFDILIKAMTTITGVFDSILPDGVGKTIAQLAILSLAIKLLMRTRAVASAVAAVRAGVFTAALNVQTAAMVRNSTASARATIGIRSLSAATSLGTRAVGGMGAALGRTNLLLIAGFAAYTLLNKALTNSRERTERTAERQRQLGDILATNGDKFDLATSAARRYIESLKDVEKTKLETVGFSDTNTGFLASQITFELASRATKEGGDTGPSQELRRILTQNKTDLEGLIDLLQDNPDNLDALKKIIDFRNRNNEIIGRYFDLTGTGTSAQRASDTLKKILKDDNTPQLVKDMVSAALEGDDKDETIFRIADAVSNVLIAEQSNKLVAEADALAALDAAVFTNDARLGGRGDEDINRELDALRNDALAPDTSPGVTLFNRFDLGREERLSVEAAVIRENIDFIKAQFEAGLINQADFSEAINLEVASLQEIISVSIDTGTNASLAEAAKQIEIVRKLEKQNIASIRDRFDRAAEVRKLIGDPLEGADLAKGLIALILDPSIKAGSSEFEIIASQIIEAEKIGYRKLFVDTADDYESAKQAIEDFAPSVSGSLFFTVSQVASNEPVNNVLDVLGVAEERLRFSYREIADALQTGLDINNILKAMVQDEIGRIDNILNSGVLSDDLKTASEEKMNALVDLFSSLDVPVDIFTGADIKLEDTGLDGFEIRAKILQDELISNFEQRAKIFAATGQNQDLGSKVKDLVDLINDPAIIDGSQEALGYAIDLADAIRQGLELEGAAAEAFSTALLGLTDVTGLSVSGIAEAGLIFQQIANVENAFNVFLAEFLGTGTDLLNGLLQTISVLMAGGASAEEALGRSVAESLTKLRRQARLADASGRDLEGKAIRNAIRRLERVPQVDIPKVNIARVHITPRATKDGGSSAADDAAKAAIELQNAKFALLRAQIGDDPVKQAVLAGQEAQFEIDIATNEAERIRGLASQVDARRGFWSAVNDVLQAENDLAIAVAGSLGDFAKVEELTVAGAKAQLDFLVASGAGAAAIASAEAAVIGAQDNQADALVNARLGDLGFLFSVGELSQQAYIAALEGVVAQLDPVADKDLWRQVTKQLHDLKGSSSELQFNLPDTFDLPTLFEVRRLNQSGTSGSTASAGGFGGLSAFSTNTDNRQIQITINVATGMDWQDARQVIGDAIGADQSVFSLNTKKY